MAIPDPLPRNVIPIPPLVLTKKPLQTNLRLSCCEKEESLVVAISGEIRPISTSDLPCCDSFYRAALFLFVLICFLLW
uniref:Uncharacterized protein n=1 Tax=Nelumbo nucifera TaxID=4432 RepID=A0A822YWE0_NELNU|nr:TPA_asm: hypothetical protein HUJ06_007653 [Nelumbo nucifera]